MFRSRARGAYAGALASQTALSQTASTSAKVSSKDLKTDNLALAASNHETKDSDFKKATQRVFHPGDRPSRIEVFVKP